MSEIQIIRTKSELKQVIKAEKLAGKSVGFVPTMGALHEGHLSLVDAAKAKCDVVVMSIFVNPLQFGANEDLDSYPKRLEVDANLASDRGVQILFAPSAEEMYKPNAVTEVSNSALDSLYCGKFRPGHFTGVLTVVAKLFNLVDADFAFFGKKDFQQFRLIEMMVDDLEMNVEVVGCETIREDSGLARSSRNEYLSSEALSVAPAVARALSVLKEKVQENLGSSILDWKAAVEQDLTALGFGEMQYLELVDRDTLLPLEVASLNSVWLIAVYLEKTRLIDNLEVF